VKISSCRESQIANVFDYNYDNNSNRLIDKRSFVVLVISILYFWNKLFINKIFFIELSSIGERLEDYNDF